MLKIDPAFLIDIGANMRRIREITSKTPVSYGYFLLGTARKDISEAVEGSIYAHLFRVPTRVAAGALLNHINTMCDLTYTEEAWQDKNYTVYDAAMLGELYSKFETLFVSDLQASASISCLPKAALIPTL